MQQAFTDANVALLRADWTQHDEAITQALASLGRSGVPVLRALCSRRSQPRLLPEVLTPGIVTDALNKLPGAQPSQRLLRPNPPVTLTSRRLIPHGLFSRRQSRPFSSSSASVSVLQRRFASVTPAPAFTATDSRGQTQSLNQYGGKYVVLEWHNQGCPYTRKHYVSGNMQNLQKEWTAKGVVWFTVISSAPGTQGYVTPPEENAYLAKMHAVPTAALLDSDGKVGRLYDAKTTPQMFVIDPQGKVVYAGAIDD